MRARIHQRPFFLLLADYSLTTAPSNRQRSPCVEIASARLAQCPILKNNFVAL